MAKPDPSKQALPMRDATVGDRLIDAIWQRTGWLWVGRWLTGRRHRRGQT